MALNIAYIKKLAPLTFLFFSGLALAQTTVTLESQCNCKVLSGNDVNSAGETTPAGTDVGDIYVNTTSGTIFYWNGSTWQLTSGLYPQIQSFSYDTNTKQLSLTIDDGTVFTVDISSLSTTTATDVIYDSGYSGIAANNVQEAIDSISRHAFELPSIYATGKVNSDGTPVVIYGASVVRISEGDYQVTFDTPLIQDYIIQVSVLDCDGDCPGNTNDPYDSPSITYYDQQLNGFKVNIGDSDNGAAPKDDIDIEFMFTTIIIPF